uniref:Uncharacterized protein n=1 Tax=Astyanax mexicanus TaxID=7994 RepID=A0A8B9JEL8_ASTMX
MKLYAGGDTHAIPPKVTLCSFLSLISLALCFCSAPVIPCPRSLGLPSPFNHEGKSH